MSNSSSKRDGRFYCEWIVDKTAHCSVFSLSTTGILFKGCTRAEYIIKMNWRVKLPLSGYWGFAWRQTKIIFLVIIVEGLRPSMPRNRDCKENIKKLPGSEDSCLGLFKWFQRVVNLQMVTLLNFSSLLFCMAGFFLNFI